MPGHVKHESGEMLPVKHLVAERIAAEPRAGLEEPLGENRTLGQRRRQNGGDISGGVLQFALDRLGFGGFVHAAAMVAQPMGADGDDGAILQRDRRRDRLAVDKGAVGGAEVADQQVVAGEFQAAVAAGHGAAFQDDLGRGRATDRCRQGRQWEPPWRLVVLEQQQEMHRFVGVRLGSPAGGWLGR